MIIKLIPEARSSTQILVISAKTVERHRANSLEKLGMRDPVERAR